MRFPLRLRAALLNSRVSFLWSGVSAPRPIFVFSPCVRHVSPCARFDEKSTELEWHSPAECVSRAQTIGSPAVWLSGAEPLLHPEIGSVANSVVESGRHVFLHTSGYGLRQRIHEFRPDSRLFLTLDFLGREEVHNRAMGRSDAFQRSLEAIRAAKLSGFLISAHLSVTAQTNLCDIGELIEFLDSRDVDGFIVSSGGHAIGDEASALTETLEDARAMIRSSPWENFSRLLDKAYEQLATTAQPAKLSGAENAFEEGD
jgi:MoaA/NifB/PqqE/SkfB family radical SAM enzyme